MLINRESLSIRCFLTSVRGAQCQRSPQSSLRDDAVGEHGDSGDLGNRKWKSLTIELENF